MTTQHTPGPWTACEPAYSMHAVRNAKNMIVADVGYSGTIEVDKANARLIAASPNMLEALKWIASHDLSGADDRAIALMAYAFVSKARFAVLEAIGEKP